MCCCFQLIIYGRDDEEVAIRVWPMHQSIASFMEGSGEALLKQALADMFRDLRKILRKLSTSLLSHVNDVTHNVDAMSDYLRKFQAKLALDDKFVR